MHLIKPHRSNPITYLSTCVHVLRVGPESVAGPKTTSHNCVLKAMCIGADTMIIFTVIMCIMWLIYGLWIKFSSTMVVFSFWVRFSQMCSPRKAGNIVPRNDKQTKCSDRTMVLPIATLPNAKNTPNAFKHVPDLFLRAPGPENMASGPRAGK